MFVELIKSDSSPRMAQQRAARELPKVVRTSKLRWWTFGSNVPAIGRTVILGIASYSVQELELLDSLNKWQKSQDDGEIRIYVYDTASMKSLSDFELLYPGIGKVFQTPVLGLWDEGVLIETKTGFEASKLLETMIGAS